MVPKVLNGPFW